jgi:hypothetical protein
VERIGVRDAAGVESDLAAALFHAETSADPPLIRVMATAPDPGVALALQLRSTFDVSLSCGGLMSPPPEGPRDDVGWADAPLRELHRNASDLLN